MLKDMPEIGGDRVATSWNGVAAAVVVVSYPCPAYVRLRWNHLAGKDQVRGSGEGRQRAEARTLVS